MLKKITKLFLVIFAITQIQFGLHADAAGILPYYKDQKTKEIFVLLGKEGSGRDKGKWADFGGTGSANIQTAAKEGHEETMGVFTSTYKNPKADKTKGIDRLKKKIKDNGTAYTWTTRSGFTYKGYLLNVTKEVQNQGGRANTLKHFKDTLKNLKKKNFPHEYIEKSDFSWVKLHPMLTKIKNLPPKITRPVTISGKHFYPARQSRKTLRMPFVLSVKANLKIFKGL